MYSVKKETRLVARIAVSLKSL